MVQYEPLVIQIYKCIEHVKTRWDNKKTYNCPCHCNKCKCHICAACQQDIWWYMRLSRDQCDQCKIICEIRFMDVDINSTSDKGTVNYLILGTIVDLWKWVNMAMDTSNSTYSGLTEYGIKWTTI